MALFPCSPGSGVSFSSSQYAAAQDQASVSEGNTFRTGINRWIDGYNVEWVAGFAQKIAGWAQLTTTLTEGIPRALLQYRGSDAAPRTAIGTDNHLYVLLGHNLTDATPLRYIDDGTLTNAVSTNIGSTIVVITDAGQNVVNGDWVFLQTSATVGGIDLDGYYPVSARTSGGYDITNPYPAASTVSNGGGTLQFNYPRDVLTNPFTTTVGSALVNVTHANNGVSVGNYVNYRGASAVGGLTIDGEYAVTQVIDTNNYVITAASPATSSAGPGGGSVGVTYDIQVAQINNTSGVGYGAGGYGVGAYGAGLVGVPTLGNGWTLAQYGFLLLAAPIGGTIYVYDSSVGGRAYPLQGAPATMNAMFVTPERFVVALGINGSLMEMAWCDQNNFNDWVSLPTNAANSGRSLIGGNYFSGGIAIRNGVSLLFTDLGVFEMTYTGTNEVYTTLIVGDNCGLVDPSAVVAEGGIAYWFSDQDFWTWNGAVTPLPSDDIRAYVFQESINRQYLSVCCAALNRTKRQVRFYYPSGVSNENSAGMIYHIDSQCWSPLAFGRSAAIDSVLLSTPVSCDINGFIYGDETGVDANGSPLPSYLEIGQFTIGDGSQNVDIMGFVPDFQQLTGTATVYSVSKYYPGQSLTPQGPYLLTSTSTKQDLRGEGKLFAFNFSLNDLGASFRLGIPRIEIQPAGQRG